MLKRILIAEDEPLTRKNITAWLCDLGYEVRSANDGAEAVKLLNSSRFDLVVSDIRMPHVDGFAVLSYLRSISPTTPFVVISAHEPDKIFLLKMGRAVFLRKPLLLGELEGKIRFLLELEL
jgi:DNA-binding response OmpR family regulator